MPGVAVSVALVPPLAVTGYGIGTGWNGPIIRGSLLLYGANLAGIVMSGMVVFIVAGMHRPEVLDVDRTVAPQRATNGAHRVGRARPRSPRDRHHALDWTRIALVGVFVAIVAVPLSAIASADRAGIARPLRDRRKRQRCSPSPRSIVRDQSRHRDRRRQTRVILNVATTGWFGDSARREFEHRASAAAGEPVNLMLEQLPASSGDVSQLAKLVSAPRQAAPAIAAPVSAPTNETRVTALRAELTDAVDALALPESLTIAGSSLVLGDSGGPPVVRARLRRQRFALGTGEGDRQPAARIEADASDAPRDHRTRARCSSPTDRPRLAGGRFSRDAPRTLSATERPADGRPEDAAGSRPIGRDAADPPNGEVQGRSR